MNNLLKNSFAEFRKQYEQSRSKNWQHTLIFDMLSIFRAQFSANQAVAENGREMGGVAGTLHYISQQVVAYNPDRVICVFDGKNNAKRKQKINEDYKADRGSKHKLLRTPYTVAGDDAEKEHEAQLRILIAFLKMMPVNLVEIETYEADEVIAYLTKNYYAEKNGVRIIFSADKDFIQLIDEHTQVYNTRKKEIYSLNNYTEFWDVPIENITYIRAVEGDASDSLTGVKGVGEKTLIKLIPELKSKPIESISEFTSLIESKKSKLLDSTKGENLLMSVDIIKKNYDIMQLTKPNIDLSNEQLIRALVQENNYDYFNLNKIENFVLEQKLTEAIHINKIQKIFERLNKLG